jgi:rubrerythrin
MPWAGQKAMPASEDQVACRLCGRWLKMVGGSHLLAAHGITTTEYREMFRMPVGQSTAAAATSQIKRQTMLRQIAEGERVQPIQRANDRPIARWRSLATRRPDLLQEWDAQANDGLDPFAIGPHAQVKVWWRCAQCAHRWQQSPKARSQGRGCPKCAKQRSIAATIARNSRPVSRERLLIVRSPQVADEWDLERNASVDLRAVAAGSDQKVWWRCRDCGHSWAAAVCDRTRATHPHGCPRCALARRALQQRTAARDQSLAARFPQLLDEWHPALNGGLDPHTIKPGSEIKAWWRCRYCGHEWQAAPYARRKSTHGGCRSCAARIAQRNRRTRTSHTEKDS